MFIRNRSLILVLVLWTQIIYTDGGRGFNYEICEGNRTNAYSKNLNSILSMITSNTSEIDNGFYNFSLGQEPNKAYVIAVCRRDLPLANCRSNIYGSANHFQEICLTSNESVGYYNSEIMFRYSYKPILDIRDSKLNCTYIGPWPAPEPYIEKLKQKSTNLLSGLIKKAAQGNSRDKSAAGGVNITASLSVYAITMCSPDLSSSYCFTCLEGALKTLQLCCGMRQGPAIYLPGCLIETENYPFLNLATWNSIPPSPLIPFTPPIPHRRTSKPGRDIYIVVGVVSVLLATASLFLYFSRRTKQNKQEIEKNNDQVICMDFKQFDFSAVQAATHNFSDAKRLGMESSARVYKGMLPGGQEIAVKMLLKIDKDVKRKFDNEVLLLTNLQHRNLVKLLGFCVQQDLMLLIYEFLTNQSHDKFLHDNAKRANLNWETRYNVIQGIGRGLSYLHDDSLLRVIHRDLKPSNILLDVDMKPKISNFIKATHVHEDQTRGASSTIKGTCWYMPPEYAQQGQFSVKSDVFSFGVLLLEIICGQMIGCFSEGEHGVNLLSYAWSKWSEGTTLDVVDPTLDIIESHKKQMLRCIKIAMLCVQENPTHRPTIAAVIYMLNNDMITIQEPSKPAHVIHSTVTWI